MEKREIEYRLADLFAMLLKSAKFILILTLIAALLGGVYGAYQMRKAKPSVTEDDVKTAEAAVKSADTKVKNAENALNEQINDKIPDAKRKLERAERMVQRRQDYIDHSLYFALEPLNCGVSRLTFYVKTDFTVEPEVAGLVEDPQASIAMAYQEFSPFDDEILDHVRKIMNTDAERRFVEELISVNAISDRFVEIKVYHSDAETAEKVVNYLFGVMVNRLQDSVAPHTASVIVTNTGYEVNWEMNDDHMATEGRLITAEQAQADAEKSLQSLQDGIPDLEQMVLDAKAAYDEAEKEYESVRKEYENTVPSLKNIARTALKYGIIGLFGGLILGCGIALVSRLYSGKLQNQNEAGCRFSIPLLGVLPRTRKIWFDKAIRKMEGESTGNYETVAQATAQSLVSRIGDRSVCLVSTLGKPAAEKLAAYTDDKIQVCGDIIDDANAVKALSEFDSVILVEQRGRSRVQLIDSEIIRVRSLGKEILGMVLI